MRRKIFLDFLILVCLTLNVYEGKEAAPVAVFRIAYLLTFFVPELLEMCEQKFVC
jgi:hypothetical protein